MGDQIGLDFKPCATNLIQLKKCFYGSKQPGKQIIEIKMYNTLYIVNRDISQLYTCTNNKYLFCGNFVLGNTSVHSVNDI